MTRQQREREAEAEGEGDPFIRVWDTDQDKQGDEPKSLLDRRPTGRMASSTRILALGLRSEFVEIPLAERSHRHSAKDTQ